MGALHEVTDNSNCPIAFFSHRTTAADKNYSTFDRELLAIFSAALKFKHLIEGRHTVVFTERRPITCSLQGSQNNTNDPRRSREFSLLAEYLDETQHISGSTNIVADCLSRPPTHDTLTVASSSTVFIDTYDLPRFASLQDTSFQHQISEQNQHACDKSIPPRPILHEQCPYPIFTQFHNLCHSNWKSTTLMIIARFTWSNAQRTIKKWCHICLTCQLMKIIRLYNFQHTKAMKLSPILTTFTWKLLENYLPSTIRHSDTSLPSSTTAQIGLKPSQYLSSLPKKFATLFERARFLAWEYHLTSRLTVESKFKVKYSLNSLKL